MAVFPRNKKVLVLVSVWTLFFMWLMCSGSGSADMVLRDEATEARKGSSSQERRDQTTPDPLKILESFHNLQIETTTNSYRTKCERFRAACCTKILDNLAHNRKVVAEDLCSDRIHECICDNVNQVNGLKKLESSD